ncbi:MAG: hypothetical protein Q8K86_02245 [Candidatus Nanopelagicaceae bacterium]|nr:hypothetical protein [Candidatus Nanopelagicaceae bacterium]
MARTAMVLTLILITQNFSVAMGDASNGHFSQQQISSFVKSVTNDIEVSKNWSASFGTSTSGKLYCHSVVLGEGLRAGNFGLYTWFTCSAMHRLDTSNASKTDISCTGFSSPVWIEPRAGKVKYQPVISNADYVALRSSAPATIQTVMDANYTELNSTKSRVVIARAVQGKQENSANSSTMCQ